MELRQALMQIEEQNGFAKGCGSRACLALRREGIDTLQQLRACGPERLTAIRGIGSRCMELIELCIQFYGIRGPAPPVEIPEAQELTGQSPEPF